MDRRTSPSMLWLNLSMGSMTFLARDFIVRFRWQVLMIGLPLGGLSNFHFHPEMLKLCFLQFLTFLTQALSCINFEGSDLLQCWHLV